MFCKQCGKSIPDNSKFCQHCGADQVTVVSPSLTVSNQNCEQKSHTISSKKIIIGSVTSFIISVAGIVAVFFPSLLNLEKKSIKELSITINTQSDANVLYKFLTDNKNKIVNLNIKYSPRKIQASNYENKSFFKNEYFSKTPIISSSYFCNRDSIELDDSDRHFSLCDFYTKELFNKIENNFDTECYESPNVYNCPQGLLNKSKDGRNLTNHGLVIDGIWYCSPMDLSCQQERVTKFETHNQKTEDDFVMLGKDLFYLPDYPYPATIFSEPAGEFGAEYLHTNKPSIVMDESVLFGNRLTFLANHYKASYINGVVNIDHGSIGFITDGTDNQVEPYYLHGNWRDFIENAKNVKVSRLFQSDNLISPFKNQKEYVQNLENDETMNLVTSLFRVNDNKLVFSDNSNEIIDGKFYVASENVLIYPDIHNVMYNSTFDKSFSIEIPYSSQSNKLYTWKSDSLRSRYPNVEREDQDVNIGTVFNYKDNHEMISLKGTFYVYAENEVESETNNFMPYHFCGYQPFSDYFTPLPCIVQKTIKLEPLSAVDLEKRKY